MNLPFSYCHLRINKIIKTLMQKQCNSLHQTIKIITIITDIYLLYNISDFTKCFSIPLSCSVIYELAMKNFFYFSGRYGKILVGREKTFSFHSGKMLAWFTEKDCGAIIFNDESKVYLKTQLNLPLTQFLGSGKRGCCYFSLFTRRMSYLSINKYIFIGKY